MRKVHSQGLHRLCAYHVHALNAQSKGGIQAPTFGALDVLERQALERLNSLIMTFASQPKKWQSAC